MQRTKGRRWEDGVQMRCRGAIFDMDGLLFDTEKIFQETWQEIADENNVELAPCFAREISGSGGEHMRKMVEKHYGVPDGSSLAKECMARVRQKLTVNVPKKPGVDEILRYFRREGVKIAVASSSPRTQIENNLKKADIHKYMDIIVSGEEVACGKPFPDIFLEAAKQMGCAPQECYVFEDSENGIKAGVAAGCRTIMVPDLFDPSDTVREMCTGIYSSLGEAVRGIKLGEVICQK